MFCQIVALISSSYDAYKKLLNDKRSICNFTIPWEYTQICEEDGFTANAINNDKSDKLSNTILVSIYKISEVSKNNKYRDSSNFGNILESF